MTEETSQNPFPTSERIAKDRAEGKAPAKPAVVVEKKVEEVAIDHGVEESFPASDPVSVSITKVLRAAD